MVLRGKIEPVSDLVDLPLHREWTYVAGTQLTAGQAKTDVLGREPDHLSWIILRNRRSS